MLWHRVRFINAYYLGNEHLTIEKLRKFERADNLINRLIHRSWGESFVTIFLDLSLLIIHCSSLTGACALGRRIEEHR
jgi:hypothetical protein